MSPATSRLAAAFAAASGRTGLIPFVTAGYPSLDATARMLHRFDALGARAVEIGIPFSDPIADGPDIQRSSEAALRLGVSVADVLALVERFRREHALPIVLMTYANPILRFGLDRFAGAAVAAGVDGLIVSDLPPDESPEWWASFDRARLDTIQLIAPTTDAARVPLLLARTRGFVYCLARTGVTGGGGGESGVVVERLAALRTQTSLPIAVGFGISNAGQVRALAGRVDAVIVGAAFMRLITSTMAEPGLDHSDAESLAVERVLTLAGELLTALM